jgi:GT2 family glycosyltransferase
MFDLTVVIPTCNRAASLAACLAAVRDASSRLTEIVVVDGASDDTTPRVLEEARADFGGRLRVITEARREGFVRAANKGFRAARGEFVTWINDDARPLPGAFDVAIGLLETWPRTVGLAALFHSTHVSRNIAIQTRHQNRLFRVLHVRGTLYANFGLGRRELFERLCYFDERYFLNAADPDFSLKVWDAGLAVMPAEGAFVDHDELADDRRRTDTAAGAADNGKLFAKWDLPDRDPTVVFSLSRPCTLRGLRQPLRIAV